MSLLKEANIGLVSITDTGDLPIEITQTAPDVNWYSATVPAGHFGIDFGIVTQKCVYAIYLDGKNVAVTNAERTGRLYLENIEGYASFRDMHQCIIVKPSAPRESLVLRTWMDEGGTKLMAIPGTKSKIDIFVFRPVDEGVELAQTTRAVGHGAATGKEYKSSTIGQTQFIGRIKIEIEIA